MTSIASYDLLDFIRMSRTQRQCEVCEKHFATLRESDKCGICFSDAICPKCLIPLESELAKNTVMPACPGCYKRDLEEMTERKAA